MKSQYAKVRKISQMCKSQLALLLECQHNRVDVKPHNWC
ncbi:hypothetical protein HMPREF1254_0230 [Prevotella sp. BV3P1]|nr:hypothetical protein HMPREF1254_0230 [Prevotella sp. BV3P1]